MRQIDDDIDFSNKGLCNVPRLPVAFKGIIVTASLINRRIICIGTFPKDGSVNQCGRSGYRPHSKA